MENKSAKMADIPAFSSLGLRRKDVEIPEFKKTEELMFIGS